MTEEAKKEEVLTEEETAAEEKTEAVPEEEAPAEDEGSCTEAAEEEETPEEPEADPKDQKIAELEDRFKRLFAEFDNFRKRSENEKAGRFADGEKAVLTKLLDVTDNFERALDQVPDDKEAEAFAEGIRMIYRQLLTMLESFSVKPIEAVGKPFNADYHNAVMHVEDENFPENTVTEEFQKGYMFGDKVLRYSMVKVAN